MSFIFLHLNIPFIFILLLSISTLHINNTVHAYLSNVTDQQALLSIRASLTGDPFGVLSSWNHSIHFCQWKGITCSRREPRVTTLNLSSHKLEGTLSPHIGNLSFLKVISLDRNSFRGSIPPEIGKLFRLQYLHLGSNSFQGGFPMNLSYCSNIKNISIEDNKLTGKLPTEFASWSKLTAFIAERNNFTGSIPPSIGNASSLRGIDIAKNSLTGSIPSEIAQLDKLEYLLLYANHLSGTVPLQLYNISSLYAISLTENELEGRLPPDLGFTLPNLQYFVVDANKFSGPVPPSITNASKLIAFSINTNYITGPLPTNWVNLLSLKYLSLSRNQLGHNQPPDGLSFIDSLVNNTCLEYFYVGDNGLSAELPNSIVNLSATLKQLDLSINHINGIIPQDIGELFNMTSLFLDRNMLGGSIPDSVCKLSRLSILHLSYNNISGVIPACIGNVTGLFLLNLRSNMLNGSIPTTLFSISFLQEVYLSSNHLSGVISEHITGLSLRLSVLNLDQNLLTGPIPSNIGSLTHLVNLRLSDNKLTGEIPTSLGDCVMLEDLYTNGNFFDGRIPFSFKALKSLAVLDLSNNKLSGNIPDFLGEFHLMQFLNLSHNELVGEVPKKGLFSNVSAFSVIGNSQICGGVEALQLHACPAKKKQSRSKILVIVVLLPLAFLALCLAFVLYRIKKSKKGNVGTNILHDDQYPRLSYQDLLLATVGFSPSNLLGEGRYGLVYKGSLESLQQTFAVKVLNVEVRGANKNFLAECETLKNIRHRNLIKIITTCSSTDFKGNDFKALVFEFMTNGSLDNWLHPSPSDQGTEINLTLSRRLNIAIDVALAVDYLHHQCHTKIIHCDIKPSNILLDEEFTARVSDFGLARFFLTSTNDTSQAQSSSTAVRGTIGYVPPEYGMGGKISTEGDVFSFGILLLEMFSGKRPTGSSVLMDNADNLHDYVQKALPHGVMEIADPRMILLQEGNIPSSLGNESVSRSTISHEIKVCLASIFEVGVLCSVEMPRDRIDISVAIKKLQVAREKFMRRGYVVTPV